MRDAWGLESFTRNLGTVFRTPFGCNVMQVGEEKTRRCKQLEAIMCYLSIEYVMGVMHGTLAR
jgi:hypothetical protein